MPSAFFRKLSLTLLSKKAHVDAGTKAEHYLFCLHCDLVWYTTWVHPDTINHDPASSATHHTRADGVGLESDRCNCHVAAHQRDGIEVRYQRHQGTLGATNESRWHGQEDRATVVTRQNDGTVQGTPGVIEGPERSVALALYLRQKGSNVVAISGNPVVAFHDEPA